MMRSEHIFRPGTIVNRAFHIGIMVAVAVHMVCGCCWHHAHAAGYLAGSPSLVEAAGCPCGHHGHQHQSQACDHESEEHGCNEGSCIFTRPDSSESSDLLAGLQSRALISCLQASPTLSGVDTVYPTPSRFAAAIPLHLLNQVLLI
jgi:hypothetical protein